MTVAPIIFADEMGVIQSGATNKASIYGKVVKVMAALKNGIPKSGEHKHHKYKYSTPDDVLDAVRPAMANVGLALFVEHTSIEQKGQRTTVRFNFTLACADTGAIMVFPWYAIADDPQDKGISKANTFALKTFLLKTFLISSGDLSDDPDSGLSSGPPSTTHPQKPTTPNNNTKRDTVRNMEVAHNKERKTITDPSSGGGGGALVDRAQEIAKRNEDESTPEPSKISVPALIEEAKTWKSSDGRPYDTSYRLIGALGLHPDHAGIDFDTIDDFGKGLASIKWWCENRPDYVFAERTQKEQDIMSMIHKRDEPALRGDCKPTKAAKKLVKDKLIRTPSDALEDSHYELTPFGVLVMRSHRPDDKKATAATDAAPTEAELASGDQAETEALPERKGKVLFVECGKTNALVTLEGETITVGKARLAGRKRAMTLQQWPDDATDKKRVRVTLDAPLPVLISTLTNGTRGATLSVVVTQNEDQRELIEDGE